MIKTTKLSFREARPATQIFHIEVTAPPPYNVARQRGVGQQEVSSVCVCRLPTKGRMKYFAWNQFYCLTGKYCSHTSKDVLQKR